MEAVGTLVLKQMQYHLGVGRRVKPVSLCEERFSEFGMIEDLPVVDDPEAVIFIVDRLRTPRKIDDAQPRAPQADPVIDIDAGLIGSAMGLGRVHPFDLLGRYDTRFFEVKDSSNATHAVDPV